MMYLNVQGLFARTGITADQAISQQNSSNRSNEFAELLQALKNENNAAAQADRVNLQSPIVSNPKIETALYSAASVLWGYLS